MPNQYPPITYEVVKNAFKKEGYILLTTNYVNCYQKLKFICPRGHIHSMNWNKWQQNRRCPYCNIGKVGNNIKFVLDDIKLKFQNEGYIVLSGVYNGQHEKLDYICPNGHKHNITLNKWFRGRRCPTCWSNNRSGPTSPNWKGGISCEPYCDVWLDNDFKESIKQRDSYRCMNPDCWGTFEKLSIHHVDYNKKNCNPNNLITLCVSCNSRANKDRDWHKSWYQAIIYRRYGYDY